ncbi:MAG: SH3 domain-containing protein [Acidobacteriota bacterium]
MMNKKLYLLVLLMAGVFANVTDIHAVQTPTGKSRIIIASNVKARSAPNVNGEEVMKLGIGTIVSEGEPSLEKAKIAGKEDYWYRVGLPDGKDGWVFGGFTQPFDENKRAAIYKQIADERLKLEEMSYADATDLFRFLSSAVKEMKTPADAATIELAKLLALHKTALTIQSDQQEQEPYKTFLKTNEASLIYSEPAGSWFLNTDALWNLHKKYATLPVAERIAWAAAQNPVGGECEGYVPCHVARINITIGRYLKLYPQGAHAAEALTQISEEAQSLIEYAKDSTEKPTAEERKEAAPEFAALRATLAKVTDAKKAATVQVLTKLEQLYR